MRRGGTGVLLAVRSAMTILSRISYTAFLIAVVIARPATAQTTTSVVSGTVSLPSPDGQSVVVPGVTLTLTCDSDGAISRRSRSVSGHSKWAIA